MFKFSKSGRVYARRVNVFSTRFASFPVDWYIFVVNDFWPTYNVHRFEIFLKVDSHWQWTRRMRRMSTLYLASPSLPFPLPQRLRSRQVWRSIHQHNWLRFMVSGQAVPCHSGNIWKWKYLEFPSSEFRQICRDCSRGRVQLVAGIANFSVQGVLRGEGGKVKFWPPISPPWGVWGPPNFFWW